ncbi:MAG: MarR family transcriptional regulator [Desulfotomaculaceae bacterium]|nr:MarR family transcriptional regulator [Desulfotomaculaceae bacterium]MDD4766372.1 MarR family transcriptional regulator [Desulfotomaculaceae bacterium]
MNCFKDEGSIGRLVSILCRHVQAHISKELRPYNIGSGQYSLLMVLSHKNGSMQEMLASELQMDKANVTRAITKLEGQGYVRRESDAADKRVYRIYLTDKGREVIPLVQKVLSECNELISSGLDEDERAIVICLLEKMVTNARVYRH